ncbi:MAG: hypothetical protein PHY80_02780 [Rickettsiales bacterium]|nr:hypothetical protein [Rickettsiales bacterium]
MKTALSDILREQTLQDKIQQDILDTEIDDEDDNNSGTGGDSSTLRDKDIELKNKIKKFLSNDTNLVIESNDEEMNEIIEKMKSIGISKDKGLELQKIRSMKKNPRTISK